MLNSFFRVAILSSNIYGGLLSTILIRGGFLNNLLFKLIGNFNLSSSAKSINNIAIKKERTIY